MSPSCPPKALHDRPLQGKAVTWPGPRNGRADAAVGTRAAEGSAAHLQVISWAAPWPDTFARSVATISSDQKCLDARKLQGSRASTIEEAKTVKYDLDVQEYAERTLFAAGQMPRQRRECGVECFGVESIHDLNVDPESVLHPDNPNARLAGTGRRPDRIQHQGRGEACYRLFENSHCWGLSASLRPFFALDSISRMKHPPARRDRNVKTWRSREPLFPGLRSDVQHERSLFRSPTMSAVMLKKRQYIINF